MVDFILKLLRYWYQIRSGGDYGHMVWRL